MVSSSYQAAIRRQLSKEVLPLTQRYLVAYQFAQKKKLEKGAGVTWTATRFNRLPLPIAPLSEGVPPTGETLQISQVTGVALQWGDKITLTDVAQLTTMYDLIQQSKRLLAVQIAETHERNAYGVLMGGTQVNYVNTRGARGSLVAGDVLDTTTINRTFSDLENLGAPFYNGQMEPDVKRDIDHGAKASEKGPKGSDHYVSIVSPLVENDLRQNPTIVTAWSYSDVTRLYINEIGYWSGIHFTKSNMMPRWTGFATTGTPTAGTAGALATNTYYTIITGTDSLNMFGESQIYAVSAGTAVTGPTGSVTITMPATTGFTYSVYIGTTTSPTNLALSASGPTSGLYAGQATQLAPGAVVVLTGTGLFQPPPAAPAAGVTVYPTLVFGSEYWACLELEDVTWTSLFEADKSDPLNQLRIVGYKFFQGFIITNQQFGARIESSVSNSGAFG
jgi:N4-gp56 family major capsid protein